MPCIIFMLFCTYEIVKKSKGFKAVLITSFILLLVAHSKLPELVVAFHSFSFTNKNHQVFIDAHYLLAVILAEGILRFIRN